MKIKKSLAALATASLIVAFTPAPANAAHNVGPYKVYEVTGDDEYSIYIRTRGSLNYAVSKNFKVAQSMTVSIEPYKSELRCNRFVVDAFKVNLGRIGNVNPKTRVKDCNKNGVTFFIDFKDQLIFNGSQVVDRCMEIVIWVVKAARGDWKLPYGRICLPRG